MNKETTQFLVDFLEKLAKAKSKMNGSFTYETDRDDENEFFSFEFLFSKNNAQFSDIAIFHYNEDFNSTEFLEEVDKIIEKGLGIME